MAITDLTNTKWLMNNSVDTASLAQYSLTFQSNLQSFTTIRGKLATYILYDGTTVYSEDLVSYWVDEAYRTIEITGGTDATNASLISWLEANATQIVEDNPLVETTISVGTKKLYNAYLGQGALQKIYKGTSLIFNRLEANFETSDHNLLITSNGDVFNVQEDLPTFTATKSEYGVSYGPYQFEQGMTFEQWVASTYNTDGWYIDKNGVVRDYEDIYHYIDVKTTDLVEAKNYDIIPFG